MPRNIPVWPGSSSFFPGDTPFGYYDNDSVFQDDADKIANWCAIRLGYPILGVELQATNLYAVFEEAISEYQNQVNTFSARDSILSVLGFNTGSINYSGKYVEPTLKGIVRIAKNYGTEAGSGGTLVHYTGSINVSAQKQVYSFTDTSVVTLETGSFASNEYTIRKVFHDAVPAINRYADPYTSLGTMDSLNQFGWNNTVPAGAYQMTPLYLDVLRAQAIELTDQIRRSSYSFQITGNRIRIFPIPSSDFVMWFNYTIDDNSDNITGATGRITDYSNIPYYRVDYRYINDMGKQWIQKYTLALAKEMLGYIRGKYSALPGVDDAEITLNGETLVSAATEEKTALIDYLKEILESFSRQAQLERKQAETEALQNQLAKIPLAIYVK